MDKSGMRFAAVFCLALAALNLTGWGIAGAQVGSADPQSQVTAGPRVVLRADPRIVESFVPAARPSFRTRESLAAITVNYTGFTPQAQAAFQHAVNIWASQLTSSVPIQIDAEFTTLGSGLLGSAGPWLVRNSPGLMANTWYPVALANKLSGTDQLPTTSDI